MINDIYILIKLLYTNHKEKLINFAYKFIFLMGEIKNLQRAKL